MRLHISDDGEAVMSPTAMVADDGTHGMSREEEQTTDQRATR